MLLSIVELSMVGSSIVELSLTVGVGMEDEVEMVGIKTPETMLDDELDSEPILDFVDEAA